MDKPLSFKEYLKFCEDMVPPNSPTNPSTMQANNLIKQKLQQGVMTNPGASPDALFTQATVKPVLQGQIQPNAMINALNVRQPGQQNPGPMMMSKRMKKKMRKR